MTLTIDIPALDRLCGILENQEKAGLVEAIEQEIVRKLEESVKSGVPRPVFQEVQPGPDHSWKGETAAEGQKRPSEPPKPGTTEKPTAPAAPAPATAAVTLDAVQKAAAQMRDEGKLKAVTDMFPEFGIKKLSDLKGDKLQAFGERLRKMGAKL